ncbi:hypothetical protein [Nocardia arizonensis]|uniref:hypothetical protein n=1 Tax=Nocardia arizonensis TaxID=1141647 RepID=UPI0006D02BDB|nr:hypothetical protein [Nocardia arizonensis]
MTAAPRTVADTAAPRGGAIGASVAALAIAAHGAAGGGVPDSADGALVLLVAMLAGALVAALPANRTAVFGVLGAGQLTAHVALSGLVGHAHTPSPGATSVLPGGWMLLAHAVATVVCGGLALLAQRLYDLVTTAIRAATTNPVACPIPTFVGPADPGTAAYRPSPRDATGPRAPPLFPQ